MRAPLVALIFPWIAIAAGCVVPIVQPAGKSELSLAGLPEDTQKVEVISNEGVTLRGLFVPAGQDAPVVLHLLPSQSSISTGLGGGLAVLDLDTFLCSLREIGYASLAIDYRGVGASDGERDPERLPDDAWAMWLEAVRRAGGQEDRVIIRGGSLGTLAVASLLERDAPARGAILIAPIRSETIAGHAARQRKGAFLGTLISVFLRRPMEVDLVAALRSTETPALVLLPEKDAFLPPEEMDLVAEVAAQNGKRLHRLEGDHVQLILKSHGYQVEGPLSFHQTGEILEEEKRFLEEIGGTNSAAR